MYVSCTRDTGDTVYRDASSLTYPAIV